MALALYLEANPGIYLVGAVGLGLIVGSFLNVVAHRLPVMLDRDWEAEARAILELPAPGADGERERYDLVVPRSRCPQCGHGVTALENVPVLSWLALRGRCSACSAPIPIRYPVVEILGGIAAGFAAWQFGVSIQAAGAMLLGWALIALSAIDLDRMYLPDVITLPFLWIGIALNVAGVYTDLRSSVIGAMAGYLLLRGIYEIFKKLTGKEGMGFGDFKLLAMLGAWFGWQAIPLIVLLSSFVGAAVGLVLIAFRRLGRDVPIPFGPYLAAAGWIAMYWGGDIMDAWLGAAGAGR